ncbi:MAG: DUF2796 domain-containing protein [Pseudomonas sp.]|uniref:DUF2796 domain-containing protein n=1 Tax=Pseudomonas sp. TaxID=306 RepID=UPI003BB4DF61
MRRLLLALPFALLPLAATQAAEDEHAHEHAEHSSLAAHEHGAAQLNVALDGNTLELALESPTMNIVGFEHAAVSANDQAAAAKARQQLQDPLALFSITPGADCSVSKLEVASPVFAAAPAATNNGSEHSDVDADYALTCNHPEQLQALELSELFKRFPAMQKIQVQLIGPKGQQGGELSPANPRLNF